MSSFSSLDASAINLVTTDYDFEQLCEEKNDRTLATNSDAFYESSREGEEETFTSLKTVICKSDILAITFQLSPDHLTPATPEREEGQSSCDGFYVSSSEREEETFTSVKKLVFQSDILEIKFRVSPEYLIPASPEKGESQSSSHESYVSSCEGEEETFTLVKKVLFKYVILEMMFQGSPKCPATPKRQYNQSHGSFAIGSGSLADSSRSSSSSGMIPGYRPSQNFVASQTLKSVPLTEQEVSLSATFPREQSVGNSSFEIGSTILGSFIPPEPAIETLALRTVNVYAVGSRNVPPVEGSPLRTQSEMAEIYANPVVHEVPLAGAFQVTRFPQGSIDAGYSTSNAAPSSAVLPDTSPLPPPPSSRFSRPFNTFQPTVPFPKDYKTPYNSDSSDESIDEGMFVANPQDLPSASDTMHPDESIDRSGEDKRKLSPAEKRVASIEECMDALEEIYDEHEGEKLEVFDNKYCNSFVNCSIECHRHSDGCDRLESCTDRCCQEPKRKGKTDWCNFCCCGCRWASQGAKLSNPSKKAARMGARLSLTLVQEPSMWLLAFWRGFELAFFVLSLMVALVGLILQKDESGGIQPYHAAAFAFSLCDIIISMVFNITQWKEIGKTSARTKERNSVDKEKLQHQGIEERGSSISGSQKKKGGKALMELLTKFLVYLMIYPLLICDIYDIVLSIINEPSSFNYVGYAVFGLGCLLTLFDVYLHRIYMLIKAARDISRKQKELAEDRNDSCCCKFQWRLVSHTVLVMIVQICILVAIGFNIHKENKNGNKNEKIDKTNTSGYFEYEYSKSTITAGGFFMIVCGLLLPFLSLALFIAVNTFWVKSYFIDVFKCVCKEGKGLYEIVRKMNKAQPRIKTWRVTALFDQMEYENRAVGGFSIRDKCRYAIGDCRTVFFSVVYFGLLIAFIYFAFDTGKTALGFVFVYVSIIADIFVLSVATFWILVVALILTVVVSFIAMVVQLCCQVCCVAFATSSSK
eukprot:m.46541 g.46541  ORF g.46541 m.46541 type:complete len:982 (+) comp33710_c0_seq3:188-3133(+)